jgi:SagB-type dehydrogenase family enzyme
MAGLFKRHIVLGSEAKAPSPTLSEIFHENTKLHPAASVGALIPSSYSYAENRAMTELGRRYPRAEQRRLVAAAELPRLQATLEATIVERRSHRDFSGASLDQATLTKLLFLTAGVTGSQMTENGTQRQLRAAPSGGALYPVETYVAVRRVEGVPPGLYHYAAKEHLLELVADGDPTPELTGACQYHESLERAAVVFLFSGVLERTKRKYGERGYRLVLLEAGHLAQNLCLASTALHLGCMNVCAFFDDPLNRFLQIDGVDEAALYVAYIGAIAQSEGKPSP